MGRKIKKAITVVIAGMIIGSQFADMSAVGSIVQAEAGDHREAERIRKKTRMRIRIRIKTLKKRIKIRKKTLKKKR